MGDTVSLEVDRLTLSDGRWAEIKRDLTLADLRKARAFIQADETLLLGMLWASITDWSFRDAQDKPVPVTQDAFEKALPARTVNDLLVAYQDWLAARGSEKNAAPPTSDETGSAPISSSVG